MTRRRPPALVYGRNPVREALLAGREVKRLLVARGVRAEPRLNEVLALARSHGAAVEEVDRKRLDDIAHSEAHQGLVAYVTRLRYWELDDLIDELQGQGSLLVVLDGVQDPQNYGSICRSAEAIGAAAVISASDRAPEVTPAVAKASAGAVEYLRICRVPGIAQCLLRLNGAGYWLVGLSGDADVDYLAAEYRGPCAIVVGAEGSGLHRLVRERCDQLVRLPMLGRVDSLNAGVAAAVVFYEALRQRTRAGGGAAGTAL